MQGISRQWRSAVCAAFAVAALVFSTAAPAFAQLDRGSISGTVKDQQGGVVPGVTVTATSKQTREARTTTTDASGFYTFANLMPGLYDVTAELQGFKKVSYTDVRLDAAGAIRMDATLEAGALTEEVTVTAESTILQTDVAVRKTVEAKDIEMLSFSGRNPIGVPALKPGVLGGSFNNAGFSSLTTGGFNINGSRSDENTITVDGAVAVRTRSTGAIIGVQNVDVIDEVQVLTANYLPEYGRASGGQIRFVTKAGSNRYSGSGSFFWRDDALQANSWSRNQSTVASDHKPAPFDYKQYGYAFGGPMPTSKLKNRLFFFGAQEWINFYQVATGLARVPTEKMRSGDFSELLSAPNIWYNTVQVIRDPSTGLPFDGNVIPSGRLSPNGMGILKLYPLPTPGFTSGTNNAIINSDNPQDQRKDNIRFDFRFNPNNNITYRFSRSNWVAVDAFRGTFPFARTDWERPNFTSTLSWTSNIRSNLINEATYAYSRDDVFINVFTESGLHKRSRTGINYPYIFPANKEIDDKIPTVNIDNMSGFDGGPYPSSSSGPIHTWSNTTTWVKGRHTYKGGVFVEYSGEDDFDQINVSAIPGGTNNQNGQFEFRNNRSGGTGVAIADMALGLYTNYAELGQRAFTKWRALATDFFVQDSWKPTANLTLEGGVRYVLWPPWYSTTNNIANFDPRYYDKSVEAVINPSTGRLVSGARYNGIVLPGGGFEGNGSSLVVAQDPRVLALFRGGPRGFSETHYNVFEPRGGASFSLDDKTILRASAGIFHNRVTLNDSTLLGGNPPFQPMVTVSNGSVDNPGGGSTGGSDLPFGMQAQDTVFKHPTSYMWSTGVQREVPLHIIVDVTYVGRRGLYLQRERNLNQLAPGTLQKNPGVNIAALRPYKGYGAIRLSENAGRSIYNSLQISADRRYSNGLKIGVAYTLSKSEDNASDKRNVVFNTYDDTGYWGPSNFDRRHVFVFHYIYDLPFWRKPDNLLKNILGGWQISGATFLRTGTPFSLGRTNDIAGVGDGGFGQPINQVGDATEGVTRAFSNGSDNNFFFNPTAFANPAPGTFGNFKRNSLRNPGDQQWDIAVFKNVSLTGTRKMQFRAEFFNFPNHPNLNGPNGDITNVNFGRATTKSGDRRDVQLAIRFLF
jgi:carboxypeptidase family protein